MADDASAGFAAVDALVALTILAVTISLVLGAVSIARRAAQMALETRQADQILQSALLVAPPTPGSASGRSADFTWRVVTEAEAGEVRWPNRQLCRRTANLQAVASGRRYALATAEICPIQPSLP